MGRIVVEANLRLRITDKVSERTTAGHKNDAAGTASNRVEPVAKMRRKCVTTAELDNGKRTHQVAFGSLSTAIAGNR